MNARRPIVWVGVILCSVSACSTYAADSACTLMTLDDAKSLIGTDAELQKGQSYETHCYYRSGDGAAYLHVTDASGHTWSDFKATGKPVKGVGDEAYFYPANNPLGGSTLVVKKGNTVLLINAWARSLSDDAVQNEELAYSKKLAPRL